MSVHISIEKSVNFNSGELLKKVLNKMESEGNVRETDLQIRENERKKLKGILAIHSVNLPERVIDDLLTWKEN